MADLTTALDDQAQLLAVKQRATEVAKVLARAADEAAQLAGDRADGWSPAATAAHKAEQLLAVLVTVIDEVDLSAVQAAAARARQVDERRTFQVDERRTFGDSSPAMTSNRRG